MLPAICFNDKLFPQKKIEPELLLCGGIPIGHEGFHYLDFWSVDKLSSLYFEKKSCSPRSLSNRFRLVSFLYVLPVMKASVLSHDLYVTTFRWMHAYSIFCPSYCCL